MLGGVVGSFTKVAFNGAQMLVVFITVFFGVIFTMMNPRPIIGAFFSLVPERHHPQAVVILHRICRFAPAWRGSTSSPYRDSRETSVLHSLRSACPRTSVAGCGEGRRDAMSGVLGMMIGAFVYVSFFETLEPVVKSLGDWGKITIPQVTHTSPWLWISVLVVAGLAEVFFDLWRRVSTIHLSPSLSRKSKV